ncbi:FG-GAP-like repeat-containing protein [Taklimakanibacter deserti]|uniref:FG-GAP-like repeat-containing protein n=1 Tax=Taklimakanibacter deserti TaxID=2267839 RepID=UPI000E64DA02
MKRFHLGYARPLLILLTILFLVSGHSLSVAATRSIDFELNQPVAEVIVTFSSVPGSHRIELRNFDQGADPIVHLLNLDGGQVGSAISRDGQLVLNVPGNLSGTFRAVVRSRTAPSMQRGELWVDGRHKTDVAYAAGQVFRFDRLASNEKVMGVRRPLGPPGHIAYLMSLDGLKILKRAAGVQTSLSPSTTGDVFAVYATNTPSVRGSLRIYRNDAARDRDGDGLGDQLEGALGTCATNSGSVAGANCNEIADPRDTDGDGLQDGWEVLGKDYKYQDGNVTTTGHLALPAWGANPRHKDIFIEIDFRRLDYKENLAGVAHHMPPETARQMAATYGDAATTDFFLKAAHAVSMDNPDRLPGISLHLDTGVAPERLEDATIYGDWGGYNAVDAAPDPNDPGWDPALHERLIGDINNDGKADIVGFGDKGVLTALAMGDGSFAPEQFAFANFGPNQGWDPAKHVRVLADINNDGMADIVAFGDAGTWTALATGGGKFAPEKFVLANFGYDQGWRNERHTRLLADINNDNMADIVAFGDAGVWTALATGDGGFGPEHFVLANFGYDQGWRNENHVRLMGDINNDDRADIVAFGDAGVWTALSNGTGAFHPEGFVLANLGYDQGWRSDKHVRLLANINNDDMMDIVAFGDAGVWTALANGAGGFAAEHFVVANLGYDQGWRNDKHVRLLADINNDDMADVVGFGDAGVWTATASGDGGFVNANFTLADFGYDQGWRNDKHVRLAGDISNDGMADIVGFGDGGVWTALAMSGGFAPPQFVNGNFGADKYVPQKPEVVWHQQMSPGRRGIFHYVMGYTTGGGSCGGGIACGFNMNDVGNSAHEFGHTLGLHHVGPYGVDEPNCKPNYPSLMNYAYLDGGYRQFSDGRNFPNFNNHALTETAAVDPSNQSLLNALENTFRYKVDRAAGSVDWNRDGQFAPAGTTVRAYANYQPGGNCEFTRQGLQDMGIKSKRSPAIVRFANTIWTFAVDLDGKLAFTRAAPAWNCAANNIDACPAAQFTPVETRDLGGLDALDAKTMRINGQEMVVVVGIRPDGSLIETTLTMAGSAQMWSAPQALAGSPAAGEPSLANNHERSKLALSYKDRDNKAVLRFRSAQGWAAESRPLVGGQPIAMHPNSSPALVYAALPMGVTAQGEHLIGAFVDPQGRLQLMTPQFPGNKWGLIDIPYDSMSSVVGRPAMAWTGGSGDSVILTEASTASAPPTTYGRLYILFTRYDAPPAGHPYPVNPMRMAISYIDRATGKLRIGLASFYDNVWAYAYGMSLVTPSDGGALRAAFTSAVQPNNMPPQDRIFFRPHADGISDLVYNNYDDWKTLAHDACTVLVAHQADSPVHCAAPW